MANDIMVDHSKDRVLQNRNLCKKDFKLVFGVTSGNLNWSEVHCNLIDKGVISSLT